MQRPRVRGDIEPTANVPMSVTMTFSQVEAIYGVIWEDLNPSYSG